MSTFLPDDLDSRRDGGGAMGSVAKRLGWNDHGIVAQRSGLTGYDGWISFNVDRSRITGPVDLQLLRRQPALASLSAYRADSAWVRLN